jgi:thiamine transporter
MKKTKVLALTECGVMVALASILSLIQLGSFPTGGSITLASMLPIAVVAYRHGVKWGLGSAFAASLVQMLLGLSSFSYVTTWQSVLAVAFLDYVFAFAVYGLAGLFRNAFKKQNIALVAGAVFAGFLRYVCHVISGATVWAGLSIPDSAALLYSLSYNATYMIPDTLILAVVATYVGSLIDFRRDVPTRALRENISKIDTTLIGSAGALLLGAFIYDSVAIFTKLQSESGEFDITLLSNVNWLSVGIVTAVAVLLGAVALTAVYLRGRKIGGR